MQAKSYITTNCSREKPDAVDHNRLPIAQLCICWINSLSTGGYIAFVLQQVVLDSYPSMGSFCMHVFSLGTRGSSQSPKTCSKMSLGVSVHGRASQCCPVMTIIGTTSGEDPNNEQQLVQPQSLEFIVVVINAIWTMWSINSEKNHQ